MFLDDVDIVPFPQPRNIVRGRLERMECCAFGQSPKADAKETSRCQHALSLLWNVESDLPVALGGICARFTPHPF